MKQRIIWGQIFSNRFLLFSSEEDPFAKSAFLLPLAQPFELLLKHGYPPWVQTIAVLPLPVPKHHQLFKLNPYMHFDLLNAGNLTYQKLYMYIYKIHRYFNQWKLQSMNLIRIWRNHARKRGKVLKTKKKKLFFTLDQHDPPNYQIS